MRASAAVQIAPDVELADIPDIDRPNKRVTVRVARRVDPLIAILDPYRRTGPGQLQFMAADQLRRDTAIADGIRGEHAPPGVSGGSTPGGPTETMLDAQGRVRRAWSAVRGPQNDTAIADVVRLVLLGWVTLDRLDASRRARRHTARRMLIVGLDRLAEHYGISRPITRS